MPAVSAVSIDLAVSVLKKYISHFTSELPSHSSQVWKDISNDLQGLWTVPAVRTNVRENRRNILTIARLECGIISNEDKEIHSSNNLDSDTLQDTSKNSSDDEKEESDKFESNFEGDGIGNFQVVLTREQWNKIKCGKPLVYKGRKYYGFEPGVWTNIVSLAFWEQYRLKCAFVFRNAKIYKNGKNYAQVTGRCKDPTCLNPVLGVIKDPPGDTGPVVIIMKCRDTRFSKHAKIKRPLNGARRKEVQKDILRTGVLAWRRNEAKNILKPEDTASPFFYDSEVLHRAKKEAADKELEMQPDDHRDTVLTIRKMNENPQFVNSILAIGDTPFYVFYATPTQLHTYAEYLRVHRHYSSICIDATGGLVKKLSDSRDRKTGYIFLYEVVINFNGTSTSVYQMLSEIHDAKFISFWLSRWLAKVKAPRQAVSDGSRALLNAMSEAFNGKSLKDYINLIFENLVNDTNIQPQTFIRLDTAHFIHSVSRWKCFQSLSHKIVKSFFLYCIALMVDCTKLALLEEIFILMLIVFNTEFEDSIILINDNNNKITPAEARKRLENLISKRNIDLTIIDSVNIDTEKANILDNLLLKDVDNKGWSKALLSWVDDIRNKASNIIYVGNQLNCYYSPTLNLNLVNKIKEFPLWTNVCTPDTMSRPTSCYVETDFKDLKMILKKTQKLPTTVIKFLKLHINSLVGSARILQLNLQNFVESNYDYKVLKEEENEDFYENWKGLGNKQYERDFKWINQYINSNNEGNNFNPLLDHDYSSTDSNNVPLSPLKVIEEQKIINKKIGHYFEKCPEIAMQNNLLNAKTRKNLNKNRNFMLLNGNITGPVQMSGEQWTVLNTCPFDTIVQLLLSALIENNFKELKESEGIRIFKFLNNFINFGPTSAIYQERLSILKPIYEKKDKQEIEKVNLVSVINCYDNICNLWKILMNEMPSMKVKICCPNSCEETRNVTVLYVNHRIIAQNGFSALERALNFNEKIDNAYCNTCKNNSATHIYIPNRYLFIELDIREDLKIKTGKVSSLREFPTNLNLKLNNGNNLRYRLTGVAAYKMGHYFAYCRHLSGQWRIYNDMEKKPEVANNNLIIEPHAVLYALE